MVENGTIDLSGGIGGGGGALTIQAATTLTVLQSIDATGGLGDGGDVDLSAGDDLSVQKSIDVSSTGAGGSGGSIRIRAGIDSLTGNIKEGGSLSVVANLSADGSSDVDGGYDGGDITLGAFGDLLFNGQARANSGSPDGGGGSFSADSSDNLLGKITNRDGVLRIQGSVVLRGNGVDSDGGDFDVDAGSDLFLDASVDVTGGSGGDISTNAGRNSTINSVLDARATADDSSGGSLSLKSGSSDFGTLTVGPLAGLKAAGSGSNGSGGDAVIAGCNLAIASGVVVDTSGSARAHRSRRARERSRSARRAATWRRPSAKSS